MLCIKCSSKRSKVVDPQRTVLLFVEEDYVAVIEKRDLQLLNLF